MIETEQETEAAELRPVPGTSLDDLDLEPINRYIERLNRPVRVETLKADLAGARPFLERQGFLREGEVTLLGLLACGADPAAYLGERCRVRLAVETPEGREEELLSGPLPALAEGCEAFLARCAGLEAVIARPLVQNALLHRDYTANRPVAVTVRPGCSLTVASPGRFGGATLLAPEGAPETYRGIVPAGGGSGPLAEVLARLGIGEGHGAGLATVAGWCLDHGLNPPEYTLAGGTVAVRVLAGSLVDEPVRAYLAAYDRYLLERTEGTLLSAEQERVLAYVLKCEWAQARGVFPLLLPPGSRPEAAELERWELLRRGAEGGASFYVPGRTLVRRDFPAELVKRIGPAVEEVDDLNRAILNAVHRHEAHSRKRAAPGRSAALLLWCERPHPPLEADQLEPFCLRIRKRITRLRKAGFLQNTGSGYRLDPNYRRGRLF